MSPYPGCVSSTDEFYMMESGVVVTDTSLEILNTRLYDRVRDFPGNSKIPNFVHLMIANRMAKTGTQWISLFSERNAGTNNVQIMILDYGLYTAGNPLKMATFHLVERIPGLIIKEDMTQTLQNTGSW